MKEETAFADVEREAKELPPHLTALADGRWALWNWAGLRGAGFPARQLLSLADAGCAASADYLLTLEDEAQRAGIELQAVLLDELRGSSTESRGPLKKAMRQLRKGILPQGGVVSNPSRVKIETLRALSAEIVSARASFQGNFQEALSKVSSALCDAASTERFREALIWQNRQALHTGVEVFTRKVREGCARDRQQRRLEELTANYLQRYCAKNDSIGFFGPIGWARLSPLEETITMLPGATLLSKREVRFEAWGIDVLAQMLSGHKALKPWLIPRRASYYYLDGISLRLPASPPLRLTRQQAAVLESCDGELTAREIAARLLQTPALNFSGEEEVYAVLELMRSRGLIAWNLSVAAPYELYPELTIKRLAERATGERVSGTLKRVLDELESARLKVSLAAGGPAEKLDRAMGQLEEKFTRLTGRAATRSAGQMYAARTLVYEDCQRNIDVIVGREILDALGPPLSLLLESARWYSFEMAALYRRAFEQVYMEIARATNSQVIDAISFWLKVRHLIFDENEKFTAELSDRFRALWSDVLALPAGERRVQYSSAALRPKVLDAFRAPRPGWTYACYHSPDVMVAARSAEAIRRGDYKLVLGEFHMGVVTISNWVFVAQHPAPEELRLAMKRDIPQARAELIVPKDWPNLTVRTSPGLLSSKDYFIDYGIEPANTPRSRTLAIGSLVIERQGGDLLVRTRDRRVRFDIIEFLGSALSSTIINRLKIVGPARHSPRVSFDRLVVNRESWSFQPDGVPFAYEKDEARRYLLARRWRREHQMPRFVFVKLPTEVKPCYVDFDSPVYVNVLAKMIRRMSEQEQGGGSFVISEMLPRHDQTWIEDAEGETYTSELRLVAVDLLASETATA